MDKIAAVCLAAVFTLGFVSVVHAQDTADSLYTAAREALNAEEYERAAEAFGKVWGRYPESVYAADALYWRAFALYRQGGEDNLREALDALERQREQYPEAGTRGDARALAVRIRGQLAAGGDPEAARAVIVRAERAADAVEEVAEGVRVVNVEEIARQARAEALEDVHRIGAQEPTCAGEADAEIRIAALNALVRMDVSADRVAPAIRRVLEDENACPELRKQALFLLARNPTPETADILLDVARNDPNPEVRAAAVFWLSRVPGERAVPALADILRTAENPEVREKALFALSRHEGERAREALYDLAADADAPVELREQAIFWIAQNDSRRSAVFLRELYTHLDDRELKQHVLFALARHDGSVALEALIQIAREEDDPELREAAIHALARSGDPRAAEVLLEIVSGES